MFTIKHIHVIEDNRSGGVAKTLKKILKKLNQIIMSNEVLNQKADELQGAVSEEKAQIEAMKQGMQKTIDDLTAANADLQAKVDAGATPAEVAAAVAKFDAIIADVKGIVPDAPAVTDDGAVTDGTAVI